MVYFLYGVFFLSCLVLIVTVLLQPGKTDAGALFTSSVSSNAYGSRGTATVLSKTTIITATIFMITALMLSMPALTGNVSVLSTNPESTDAPAASTSPATDSNTATNSNSGASNVPVANAPVTTPAEKVNSNVAKTAEKKEDKKDEKKDAKQK